MLAIAVKLAKVALQGQLVIKARKEHLAMLVVTVATEKREEKAS